MWTENWVYERIALCMFQSEDVEAILKADSPCIEVVIDENSDTFRFKRAVEEEDIVNFPSSTFYKLSEDKKYLDIFKKQKIINVLYRDNKLMNGDQDNV